MFASGVLNRCDTTAVDSTRTHGLPDLLHSSPLRPHLPPRGRRQCRRCPGASAEASPALQPVRGAGSLHICGCRAVDVQAECHPQLRAMTEPCPTVLEQHSRRLRSGAGMRTQPGSSGWLRQD
jgi:hypothetical protein